MQILPFDYLANSQQPGTGLASLAGRIAEARKADDCDVVLLVDNGDAFQGSPLSELMEDGALGEAATPHPMIAAMNALRYDAMAAGNHDFAFGMPFLDTASLEATFPILCANVFRGGKPVLPAHAILERRIERDGLSPCVVRIGVFGLVPTQTVAWERARLGSETVAADMVETAREQISGLRAAGADVVIALAHTGTGPSQNRPNLENAARVLSVLDGLDGVIAGHIHQRIPKAGTAEGVAARIVMPGAHGTDLGVLDLDLRHDGEGWSVVKRTARLLPAHKSNTKDGRAIHARTRGLHNRAQDALNEPIGTTPEPISSAFSLVAPCPVLSIFGRALARHAADAGSALPLVAAVSPFRAGGHGGPENFVGIGAGPVLRRHIPLFFPFPDRLCAIDLSGQEVLDWLEHAAGAFATLEPGQTDQPLFNVSVPSYQTDVLYGLRYKIDPTRRANRVSDVCLMDGSRLDPAGKVRLLTTAFRGGGGGGYVRDPSRAIHYEKPIRHILTDYLSSPAFDPGAEPIWTFASHPGTRAWFDSQPEAGRSIPFPANPALRDDGLTGQGFRRLSVAF